MKIHIHVPSGVRFRRTIACCCCMTLRKLSVHEYEWCGDLCWLGGGSPK